MQSSSLKRPFLLFGPGTPELEGFCVQKSRAARGGCCSCGWGSRMQVLEGAGGLMSGAELKTGLRNAAAPDGMPAQSMKRINQSVKSTAGEKTAFSAEQVEARRRRLPDLSSSSSCWGWENPRQPDGRAEAAMAEECAE